MSEATRVEEGKNLSGDEQNDPEKGTGDLVLDPSNPKRTAEGVEHQVWTSRTHRCTRPEETMVVPSFCTGSTKVSQGRVTRSKLRTLPVQLPRSQFVSVLCEAIQYQHSPPPVSRQHSTRKHAHVHGGTRDTLNIINCVANSSKSFRPPGR